jgi:antiphage defense system Thoeris ThsB-like protein
MPRSVFYSFHFKRDVHRVAQIRSIGAIEGNAPANDNDWHTVTKSGDAAIEKWIAAQMQGRSCTVVLVGTETAKRKWINHEIVESWKKGLGIVGIHIHGIKSLDGYTSSKGANPFDSFTLGQQRLSSIVKCYDPQGADSKQCYDWVCKHLGNAIEEAISIRKQHK